MSFNIRLGLGQDDPKGDIYRMKWGINLPAVIAAIRAEAPDIVALQEVAGISQISEIAQALGMNYAFEWHPNGSTRKPWWGVGILTNFPIITSRGVEISSGKGNARSVVIATVDTGSAIIDVVSVHKDKDLKDGISIQNLMTAVSNRKHPTLLIGDFNITPNDHRLDVIKENFLDTAIQIQTKSARETTKRGTFYSSKRRIDYVFAETQYFNIIDASLSQGKH
ncbi:MAG: endonuclease/exonuclease/phosphatase family protein, partial [Rhodospirillales bacterium]|nr:endonuclease/exonuclease/phosphatase family protein [Rhodospirillales bacterium]